MKIDASIIEKYRRGISKKSGAPRSERDELLDIFLARLNASRIKDGYPKLTHARVAKMLEGRSSPELYQLFKECDDPSVRSFGAMMSYKLKASHEAKQDRSHNGEGS